MNGRGFEDDKKNSQGGIWKKNLWNRNKRGLILVWQLHDVDGDDHADDDHDDHDDDDDNHSNNEDNDANNNTDGDDDGGWDRMCWWVWHEATSRRVFSFFKGEER